MKTVQPPKNQLPNITIELVDNGYLIEQIHPHDEDQTVTVLHQWVARTPREVARVIRQNFGSPLSAK